MVIPLLSKCSDAFLVWQFYSFRYFSPFTFHFERNIFFQCQISFLYPSCILLLFLYTIIQVSALHSASYNPSLTMGWDKTEIKCIFFVSFLDIISIPVNSTLLRRLTVPQRVIFGLAYKVLFTRYLVNAFISVSLHYTLGSHNYCQGFMVSFLKISTNRFSYLFFFFIVFFDWYRIISCNWYIN